MKMHEMLFRINMWNVMFKLFNEDVEEQLCWRFTPDELNVYKRLCREYGDWFDRVYKDSRLRTVKVFTRED